LSKITIWDIRRAIEAGTGIQANKDCEAQINMAGRKKELPTQAEFMKALNQVVWRRGQREILSRHMKAPGRALTASRLAQLVGYQNHGGINLQYGLLAKQIGSALNRKDAKLSLLVEFLRPKLVTNTEWVLVMRPAFAEALTRARWV
jgi:hypothetical protein